MKDWLEKMVTEGKILKEEHENLKGGYGKVTIYKDLRPYPIENVYETGWIILSPESSIGNHQHVTDAETYTVLSGKVESNGKILIPEEESKCKIGGSHDCINLSQNESIVRFVKRKK